MAYKTYDLASPEGVRLRQAVVNGRPAELVQEFAPLMVDDRRQAVHEVAMREGQGSFRIRVLDAYGR